MYVCDTIMLTFCIAWLLHFRWLFTLTYTKVGERACPHKWNIVDGQMAVIAAVFMPTDRVSKLNHGKGTKVLLAATSDRPPVSSTVKSSDYCHLSLMPTLGYSE